jgi:Fic family protein
MRSLEDVAERSLRGKSCNDSAKLLLTALERELGNVQDEIPKGFRTIYEWAKLWNRGENTARTLISEHVKLGRMEKKMLRKTRLRAFYRAVK